MAVVHEAPTDAAIVERALRFANIAMFTIALQRRRLWSVEPEDKRFVFRWWADLEFMITALRRLRRAAQLAARAATVRTEVVAAIAEFDAAVPSLLAMRNIAEHIDDYGVDARSRGIKDVAHTQLEVSAWDGTTLRWLGQELNADVALKASAGLFRALKAVAAIHRPPKQSGDGRLAWYIV